MNHLDVGSEIDDLIEDLNERGDVQWSIDYGIKWRGVLRNSEGWEFYANLKVLLAHLQRISETA